MLLADARVDEKRSLAFDLDDHSLPRIDEVASAMQQEVTAALRADFGTAPVTVEVAAEMRYRGQRSSIEIPVAGLADARALRERFLESYRRRYGHADEFTPIDVIGIRVTGLAATAKPDLTRLHRAASAPPQPPRSRSVYAAEAGRRLTTQVVNRFTLSVGAVVEGPAVIEEFGATCVIGPDDKAEIGPLGELRVSVG
jgi:N-methylhydantoinase A